jgi:signal transduction histidine kinase
VRANKQELFIQVDDTSPGVSKSHIGKLFDRLYRVEESRSRASGGSGLGLSICQSFVELMSGTINALPGKSGGLCIRILLPLGNK